MRRADAFEMVQLRTWIDEDFERLPPIARLLFLWSWTSPLSAICGLYEASPKQMLRGVGLDGEAGLAEVGGALRELAAKPLVLYDDDAEVLWVVNRVRHANRSPKVAAAMRREYEACPPSPLKRQFAERYGQALGL